MKADILGRVRRSPRRLVLHALGLAPGPGRDRRARKAMVSLERLFREQGVSEEATTAIRAERDLR